MEWIIDGALTTALLALALGVLTVRDLRRACLLFIAFGAVLGVSWLRLGAPELALAEWLVGAGLTGAMLLRAVGRLPTPELGVRDDDER